MKKTLIYARDFLPCGSKTLEGRKIRKSKIFHFLVVAIIMIFSLTGCGAKTASKVEKIKEDAVGYLNLNGVTEEEFRDVLVESGRAVESGYTSNAVAFEDLNTLLLALNNEKIVAANLFDCVSKYISDSTEEEYEVKSFANYVTLSMGVLSENEELLKELNYAIDTLNTNGTLANLKEEYITNCDAKNMPVPASLPKFENAETIRVVVTGDLPPIDYITADGSAAGYNIALLSEISKLLEKNIVLVTANSGSRSMMLTSGKADVIFWTAGALLEGQENPDYSCDVPENVSVTNPYLATKVSFIEKSGVN